MEIGIVGLVGVGKTTLFNALTGTHVDHFTDKAHLGVADIPDPRVEVIGKYIKPKQLVHATLQLVDIPGLPRGSDTKKLNKLLEQVRQVEALCQVVRCFDDGSGVIDPAADINALDTEFVLADLVVAESARDRAAKYARGNDRDAKARLEVLEKLIPHLEEGNPMRTLTDWNDSEQAIIRGMGFVTAKPVLYVANIAEDHITQTVGVDKAVHQHAATTGNRAVSVCASLEVELAELDEADRDEMLQSMGLSEPAVGLVAHAAQDLLGLTTFFTAGDKQVRAWHTPTGSTAPEAAGDVHSDMQRGFIRAECYHVEDLVKYESEKAIREAGKMRSEGKHYQVQDGDVILFLFNV